MEQPNNDGPVALGALLAGAAHDGPLWSLSSEQLNINLIRLSGGAGIASHVNAEVDVLIVAIDGAGVIALDGREYRVRAGDTMLLPRGASRAIASAGDTFGYLTCHRRRAGLMPS